MGYWSNIFACVGSGGSGDVYFGALTRSGADYGLAAPSGATSITGGTATGYTLSGGYVYPTTAGSATSGTIEFDNAVVWTVQTIADAYSVRTATGLLNLMTTPGVATLSGKTVLLRPGTYLWNNSTFNSRSFTSITTFESHDRNNRAILQTVPGTAAEIRAPTNLKLSYLNIVCKFTLGVSNGSTAPGITLKNNINGFYVHDCDLDGDYAAVYAANGAPFRSNEYSWRGTFGTDGTAVVKGPAEFRRCTIHDTRRGLSLTHGTEAQVPTDKWVIEGCTFYNCYQDTLVLSGNMPAGADVLWNTMDVPIPFDTPEVQPTSIDVALNQMTMPSDRYGASGSVTINIGPSTTTPPTGLNYPGVGGANDYACTIVSVSGGSTVLQFPVDFTTAGTNVYLKVEPAHADVMQFIPNAPVYGVRIIGNRMLGKQGLDGLWAQNIFMEDISGVGPPVIDRWYENTLIAANMIYGGDPKGIYLYNGLNSIIADNTVLTPSATTAALRPQVSILTHRATVGSGNVLYNNAAWTSSSVFSGDIDSGNHDLAPSGYSGSGLFDGTGGYEPTTIAGMTTAFARTDLDGVIDYTNKTYDLPSVNSCTLPDPVDVTGATTGAVTTVATPVQITNVLNSAGAASSYGVLVSIAGAAGSPQFQVTSDLAGSSVVTAWTSTPTVASANHYVWTRLTAAGTSATARSATLRAGSQFQTWTVTTA